MEEFGSDVFAHFCQNLNKWTTLVPGKEKIIFHSFNGNWAIPSNAPCLWQNHPGDLQNSCIYTVLFQVLWRQGFLQPSYEWNCTTIPKCRFSAPKWTLVVAKIEIWPTGKTVCFRPLVYFWRKSYIWPENCVKQKKFTKKFQIFFQSKSVKNF